MSDQPMTIRDSDTLSATWEFRAESMTVNYRHEPRLVRRWRWLPWFKKLVTVPIIDEYVLHNATIGGYPGKREIRVRP